MSIQASTPSDASTRADETRRTAPLEPADVAEHKKLATVGDSQPQSALWPDAAQGYASANNVASLRQGGVSGAKLLGQFQFSAKPQFVSVKAGLESIHPKDQRAAERLFKSGHALQKRDYPNEGEVEELKVARAYLERRDISWDRKLQLDNRQQPIGEIDLNLMQGSGSRPFAAIEHGSSHASPSKAKAFFDGVVAEAKANGARLVIAEMNLPEVMSPALLVQDSKRPWARADNIEFMCGDPSSAKKPGMGFQVVAAANGERALYGQLAFANEAPIMHLALGIKVLDETLLVDGKIPTQVYLDAIKRYFSSFENVQDEARATNRTPGEVVEANPTFIAIRKDVEGKELLELLGAGAQRKTHAADGLGATNTAGSKPDIGRPASTLPKFSPAKFWDADSTPPWLASLSRVVGAWAPQSGGRTPEIEAGIVMASLMHDVAYYYGGWISDKQRADKLFGDQIPFFTERLDPEKTAAAKMAAKVDVAAVALAGGPPFRQSYSWSYGFEQSQRGYATLDPGQNEMILQIARDAFKEVVYQIADRTFELSDVLAAKLARTSPEYQADLEANMIKLAKSLQLDFESGHGGNVPGFSDR